MFKKRGISELNRSLFLFLIFLFSCSENLNPSPVFDIKGFSTCREGFLSIPFPSEFRREKDGKIFISCINTKGSLKLVDSYLHTIEEGFEGWGTNSGVYFLFQEIPFVEDVPHSPEESLGDDFPFAVVNIDPQCTRYSEKIPLNWYLTKKNTNFLPPGVIALMPVPGAYYEPGCVYAGYVKGPLVSYSGEPFRQPEGIKKLLRGKCDDEIICEQTELFNDYLSSRDIPAEDILIFTTFRTGKPRDELLRGAEYLINSGYVPEVMDISYVDSNTESYKNVITGTYYIYEGHARLKTFQQGEAPYFEKDSGYIQFDVNGNPVETKEESVRFTFAHKKGISGKIPCVLYVHGTGGSAYTIFYNGSALNVTQRGIGIMSFDSPLHGERIPGSWDPTFTFFNFFNLLAARDNIRETALEIHQFVTLLKNFSIPEKVSRENKALSCDPDKIFYMGHSQGSITGIPYLGIDHRVKGAVISGGGGVLIYSLINKEKPFAIQPLIRILFGRSEEIKPYNLLLNLFQTFFEPADAAVYAPFSVYDQSLSPDPVSLFVSEGMQDGYTPPENAEAMCGAGSYPQVNPVSRLIPLYQIGKYKNVEDSPVVNNFVTPDGISATVGFVQFPDYGHFALFDSPCGFDMWGDFFEGLSSSDPVINTSCLQQ